MSKRTREFFAALKEGAGAVWDGAERAGMQGAAELASALFNGHAYVPYGVGQQPADKESAFEDRLKAPVTPEPEKDCGREM